MAFRWTDEIAPKADLYINDYNLESDPQKRAGFIELVNKLLQDDVPIDGVSKKAVYFGFKEGLQGNKLNSKN